jgi:hypothetical protein
MRKFLFISGLVIVLCHSYSSPTVTKDIAVDGIGLVQLKPFSFINLYKIHVFVLLCTVVFLPSSDGYEQRFPPLPI